VIPRSLNNGNARRPHFFSQAAGIRPPFVFNIFVSISLA
jgi:hypothetical protein